MYLNVIQLYSGWRQYKREALKKGQLWDFYKIAVVFIFIQKKRLATASKLVT